MTWLLVLYPPRWRRRYGDELRAMLAAQRFSIHSTVDLIAGAIDAWLEPQNIPKSEPVTAGTKEGETMMGTTLGTMMKLGCTEGRVSREDRGKSLAVNLGGTLVLTLVWLMLRVQFGHSASLSGFSALAFLVPYLFSLRYTSLKGRSAKTQAIFIGGMTLVLIAIFSIAAFIGSRL